MSRKLLMLGISITVFAIIILYFNPLSLAATLSTADFSLLAVAAAVAFLGMCLGVLKWKVLLRDVSFIRLFPVQILGYTISNFTPGKAGEPAKAVVLKAVTKKDVSASLPSIVWERVIDIVVLLALSLVAITSVSVSGEFFAAETIGIGIFLVIVLLSFLILFSRKIGRKIFSLLRKLPVLRRLPENFMDLFYNVRVRKRDVLLSLFLAVTTWIVEGLVLYFVLLSFGIQISPLLLSGIVAISMVIGIASYLPGGVGTTEAVMIFLLGVVGVNSAVAAASALAFRFLTLWFLNALGGLCFIYLSRKFEIKNLI